MPETTCMRYGPCMHMRSHAGVHGMARSFSSAAAASASGDELQRSIASVVKTGATRHFVLRGLCSKGAVCGRRTRGMSGAGRP